MIIDCHTHLDNVTGSKDNIEKRLSGLLKNMKENGITHSLILADIPLTKEEGKFMENEEIIKAIKDYSNLHLVAKVPLNVANNKKYLEKVKKHILSKKIVGVKLYPGYEKFYPFDKRYNSLYNLCEKYDIPVMFHSGDVMTKGYLKYSMPIHIDELASKRPNLKIIICHMGSPWILDTAAVTTKNKNVYTDTSGLFYNELDLHMQQFIERKIEEFINWNPNSEKIIFGSDWPITSTKDTLEIINSLPHFMDHQKEEILYKNAKKLFRID